MEASVDRSNLRDVILGGQDGLVNVLGVTLGVAAASGDTRLVLAAGLAATFAESVSMAAVAYTSSLAVERALVSSLIVGFSAIFGSFIPLLPFLFLPLSEGILIALSISAGALFFLGMYKAKLLGGSLLGNGLQIAVIGIVSALVGYAVGTIFRVQ